MPSARTLLAALEGHPSTRRLIDLPVSRLDLTGLRRDTRRSLERHIAKAGVRTIRHLLERRLAFDEAVAVQELVLGMEPPEDDVGELVALDDHRERAVAPLPPRPTRSALVRWAAQYGVVDLLDEAISDFATLSQAARIRSGVPDEWVTFARVIAPDEREYLDRYVSGYASVALISEARSGLERWAQLSVEGLVDERERAPTREAGPEHPSLRAAWERLRVIRRSFRTVASPRFYQRHMAMRLLADPPSLVIHPTDTGDFDPVTFLLETGRGTLANLDDPALGLAICDLLIDLLTDPALADDRAPLIDALSTPGWQRDLAWLDKVTHTDPDPDDDKNLLVWRIETGLDDVVQVIPCRARRKKKGTGYVTRQVPLGQVPLGLRQDPADEVVYDLLSRWRVAPRDTVLQAVRALVGHPRVLPPGRGADPMPVRLVTLTLRLEAGADELLRLVPVLDGEVLPLDRFLRTAEHNAAAGLYVEADERGVRVAELREATLRFLRLWTQRSPTLPPEALPDVLRRLPQLTAHAPLTLAPALHGSPVEGDPRPLVRLDGSGDGLRVQLRVRPLPGSTPEEPGGGPPELYDVRGTRVVHVPRDLDAEVRTAGEAIERLELPDSGRVHRWDWWLQDVQQALAVIAAVREHPAGFQVEWTGEVPSVRRAARARDLKLTVRRDHDWFGLDGSVEVDGATVPLGKLLDAALEGDRFVQVADGSWVGIEAALAERLAAAGAVPTGRKGERQLGSLHAPVVEALAEAGAEVDAPQEWLALSDRAREAQGLEAPVPADLRAELRPYQADGFRWLASLAHWAPGACLADDMGLGKTVQAIALLLHRRETGPALVVGPMSLVFNWQRELERFAPSLRVRVYHGSDRAEQLADLASGDVVLTTYGVLVRDAAPLAEIPLGTLVLDESQAIKNPESQRARAARGLQAGFRLALSGTPVENHLGDLWSLLAFVAPGLLGMPAWFRERFSGPIEGAGDARRRRLLARVVRPFLLRRTKAEVAPDLPERVEVVHAITLSDEERALYDAARRSAVHRLSGIPENGKKAFQVLVELQRLRQLSCHPRLVDAGSPVPSSKLKHALRLLEDLRESGHKVLVFSSFVQHLALVREALEQKGFGLCYLDGGTAAERRRAEVDRFQAGEADAFLISLKAGGTGLNLTAATYVIHLDPWWNPATEDQATDRAHRIGQEHAVTVYRLVARGTIEERIVALHAEKRELAEAILSGADEGVRATTEELVALLAEANLDVGPEEPEQAEEPVVRRSMRVEIVEVPSTSRVDPEPAPDATAEPAPDATAEPAPDATAEPAPVVDPLVAADLPRPSPPVTDAPADAPADGWTGEAMMEQFLRHLDEEHAAGRLATKATVRAYGNAVRHLVDWADGDRFHLSTLEDLGERYVEAVQRGEVPHRSDRVFGKPAFRRLAWLLSLG